MKRCFLKLSLCLSIISNFLSACGNEELMSKLEDVESYLCEAPDSALSVLDSIPEESLSSGKLRAKYALLRSIALDKNYIDVTSDSIIRPAVEYYSRRGSAKERLETYYYRGTISFNGGDLDSAADWFVKGCQFAGKSGVPPRMSAMIYFSLYLVYDAVYDYGKAYTSMLCAYDYFCEAEENETLAELVEKAKSKIERLQKIRQKKLDPLAIEMIDERLVLLNKCVIGNVCGNMENEARKAIKVLTEDHDRFLLSTRAAFMLSHSDVLSLMKKKGLNEEELNISCLYGMGMNSEDVAKYLGMKQKQVYSFNMSIRTKLGIARNDSGLPDYMVKQFALKVRSDKSTEEKLQES